MARWPDPPRPLYRLPELPDAGRVFVLEGEKCADLVCRLGLTATTSSEGAQAAHKTDWSPLAGKDVVILPDRDKPGEDYAAAVLALLRRLDPPPRVRVVRLPGLLDHQDVEQWLAAQPHDGELRRARYDRLIDPPVAVLPHAIAACSSLLPIQRLLVAALLYHTPNGDTCMPSNPELAQYLGTSVPTVKRGLAALTRRGWIEVAEAQRSGANPTGRTIRLTWYTDPDRLPPCEPGHRGSTGGSPMTRP
jgi:hypothetical protein